MSDADTFLLAFHRAHPGCTSEAFGRGRIEGRGSSYDVLADCVPEDVGARVLDLACGDGHLMELLTRRGLSVKQLVGVDMSADELALARQRGALAGASLVQGQAQALPLEDGGVAAVLCHLAIMLMDDVEAAVGEVRRVLRPGGVFAALVGGGPKVGDAFELFLDLLIPILRRVGDPVPKLGDPRCRSAEGLGELLGAGFEGPPRIEDFAVDLSGTFDAVWSTLSTIYEMHGLGASATAELREAFEAGARALSADGVTVPCSMFVRLAVATRVG